MTDDLPVLAEWETANAARETAPVTPPPVFTAAEHYLRAVGALSLAQVPENVRKGPNRVARLLGVADLHLRLALVPEEIAAEARDLYAQAEADAQATTTEGDNP